MQNNEISSMSLELSENAVKKKKSKPGNQNTQGQQAQGLDDSVKVDKDAKESKITGYFSFMTENIKMDKFSDKESENLTNNCDTTLNSAETFSLIEEKNSKDVELDRLLRLASSKLCSAKHTCTEQKEMRFNPQEKKMPKKVPLSKESELSLLDFLGSQGDEESVKLITKQIKKEDNFVKQFNSDVKNLFLFSSESSSSDASESEKEKSPLDEILNKKIVFKNDKPLRNTVPNDERKGKDLQKYRKSISDFEEERQVNSSKEVPNDERKGKDLQKYRISISDFEEERQVNSSKEVPNDERKGKDLQKYRISISDFEEEKQVNSSKEVPNDERKGKDLQKYRISISDFKGERQVNSTKEVPNDERKGKDLQKCEISISDCEEERQVNSSKEVLNDERKGKDLQKCEISISDCEEERQVNSSKEVLNDERKGKDLQKCEISISDCEEERQVNLSKEVLNDERKGKDLQKHQISISDCQKERQVNSSKKEEEIPKVTSEEKPGADENDCDIILDSRNFVEVILPLSDSDSEIVQINEVPRKSIPIKGKKKISKILSDNNLQQETKLALKLEMERKRRLEERQKLKKGLQKSSKLVLDFDPDTMQELVVVDKNLSKHLKPHQWEGVQFMWNCCFESLKRIKEEKGSGCVLAHCMGLGKSLQVIALIHSVLSHSSHLRTVLIMCPFITLKNWFNEFKIWMTDCSKPIKPFNIGISTNKKLDQILKWMEQGGVLIISYEMFRTLVKKRKYSEYWRFLLDPGPDIVICDEGHLMKNPNSELSKCVTSIRTLRRIILTGTPLQNNLMEYYCMVQFVKPNLLGTKKEFMNRFVNPITRGQFENSTREDVFIMKQRSHVLHTLLESFVQRLGYDVLEPLLPKKQEFVIFVALTEIQENMYSLSLNKPLKEGRGLLWDFHWFHKIWTHPLVMRRYFDQNNVEKHLRETWEKFVPDEDYDNLKSSNKLRLFFSILRKCRQIGDKVLVFSQSLYTLGLIENFLLKLNYDYVSGRRSEFADSWVLNRDYFKLTGSTKSEEREVYHKNFSTSERACLFLISTKVGGLGINLTAANRVVLFDASWNPAHDLQSIFRVYRFGQKKPCYIYRFLAAATMEEKIYRRQITKLSLAHRILDEHQIERHYSSQNLLDLYTYSPPPPRSEWKVPKIPKDEVFAEILSNNRDLIVSYHEHNSLLENKEEEELTEEERQAAWENYEKEKISPRKIPVDKNTSSTVQRPSCKIIDGWRKNSTNLFEDQRQFVPENQDLNGYPDIKNLLELGSSFGLKPYEEEAMEMYLRRIERALKNIFPWGTPRVIIQGDVLPEA